MTEGVPRHVPCGDPTQDMKAPIFSTSKRERLMIFLVQAQNMYNIHSFTYLLVHRRSVMLVVRLCDRLPCDEGRKMHTAACFRSRMR